MMNAFHHIIRPQIVIPSKPQKHITYKKDDRQVSFDMSNNKVYVYVNNNNE